MRAVYGYLRAPKPRFLIVGVPFGRKMPQLLAVAQGNVAAAEAAVATYAARGYSDVTWRALGLS